MDRPRILGPVRRDVAISTLRGYLPALRRDFGVRRISLFGSTARDEAREDSDLDLLMVIDYPNEPMAPHSEATTPGGQ